MFGSLFSKPHKKGYIIFTIESGAVIGAFVKVSSDKKYSKKPVVEYSTRIRLDFEKNSDGGSTGVLYAAFVAASENLLQSGVMSGSIDDYHIHVVLHSPWCVSDVDVVASKLREETKITDDLLSHITKKIPREISDGFEIFEEYISDVKLNGYSTLRPFGRYAQRIELAVIHSLAATAVLDVIYNALANTFANNHNIFVHSFTTVIQDTLLNFWTNSKDVVTASVSESTSDLIIFRGGVAQSEVMQEFGSDTLIEQLSENMKVSKQQSESLFELYVSGKCNPSECKRVRGALSKIAISWGEGFGNACSKLTENKHMPQNVILFTDSIHSDWLTSMVEKIDFGQFTITGSPFIVHSVTQKDIHNHVRFVGNSKPGVTLGVTVLFVNRYTHKLKFKED